MTALLSLKQPWLNKLLILKLFKYLLCMVWVGSLGTRLRGRQKQWQRAHQISRSETNGKCWKWFTVIKNKQTSLHLSWNSSTHSNLLYCKLRKFPSKYKTKFKETMNTLVEHFDSTIASTLVSMCMYHLA